MTTAAEKVIRYTSGMDARSFSSDEKTRDAVLRNLEVIGEAVKRIPADELNRTGSLEWHKVAGFRDIVAHAYFAIDDGILWDIVSNKVPALAAALKNKKPVPDR